MYLTSLGRWFDIRLEGIFSANITDNDSHVTFFRLFILFLYRYASFVLFCFLMFVETRFLVPFRIENYYQSKLIHFIVIGDLQYLPH